MKKIIVIVILATGQAIAFDPPRIIGELYGTPDSTAFGYKLCCVGDQNNDGYDDFILQNGLTIELYLGGNPMDTVAYLRGSRYAFEPRVLGDFAMLPEVNGDGFDDWGCAWGSSSVDSKAMNTSFIMGAKNQILNLMLNWMGIIILMD